jgi:hypothetical protein
MGLLTERAFNAVQAEGPSVAWLLLLPALRFLVGHKGSSMGHSPLLLLLLCVGFMLRLLASPWAAQAVWCVHMGYGALQPHRDMASLKYSQL